MLLKVLIVDDEQDIRLGLKNFFAWESIGFAVAGMVEDGAKALQFLKKQPVDVVLTDIVMPNMTGIDLAKTVSRQHPGVKIVFLSAYEEFRYAREALEYGVRGYIIKPTHFDDIIDVFTRVRGEILTERGDDDDRQAPPRHKSSIDVVRLVEDYLQKNYKTATLEEAAFYAHYNPFYLSSFFKRQTGKTFSDSLLRIRMEKAAEMLRRGDQKIYEVSEAVGYSNPHNFIRTFKAFYKTTPSNYKKEYGGGEK